MNTTQPQPTAAITVAQSAANYRARKAARIARKRNRAQSPQHKAAIARRIELANTAEAMTGKVHAL
jgi:hypothetical protein